MAETVDLTQQPTASILPFLRKLMTAAPPAPPPEAPEDVAPPPLQMTQQAQAAPQVTQQQPGDVSGLANLSAAQAEAPPRLAGETKGHKLLRILLGGAAGAGAGAGQMTFGGGFQQAQMLPLQVQHQQLQNEQVRQMLPFLRAQQMAGLGKTQAETQKLQGEVEGMPIKQALERAQTEAAFYKEDPNLGTIDIRTRQPISTAGVAPLTAEEAQVLGKQPGEKVPLKLKNTASEIVNRGFTTVNTEEGVYERNRGTGSMTRLGSNPRMMFAPENRIIEVANPDKPGETMFVKAGEAVKGGLAGKSSASVAVPKNVLKWATTGEGGKMAGAFNTAIAHAELLEKAITALDSRDVRTLNSIKNSFKKEFGSSDITNLQVISNAYAREITKMLSSGHMTNSEIDSAEATLPLNASPEQMLDAIHSYKALAGSKMVILHDQFVKGMQGKPNFPETQPTEKKNPFR